MKVCVIVQFFLQISHLLLATCQLVINVKNQGGDVVQESLYANITEDTVLLEFQRPDGTLVSQLLDFKREVQIFRVIVLTEDEQVAQSSSPLPLYETICFVTRLYKQDFIAADAIAKLRQKNPNTVRIPEEDNGTENTTFQYAVSLRKSATISNHIRPLCKDAEEYGTVFAQEADLKFWAAQKNPAEAFSVLEAVQQTTSVNSPGSRCKDTSTATNAKCRCQLNFCLPWYPCGLKFCRGHDATGKVLSYRCGIKTCRKCLQFHFSVSRKELCMWDNLL